ncbi:hypothetical protein AB0442_39030 [Kitasatospora sp. NPDC085895]|uniref:hypothetical protein n=1 Tax=Kitasatospora sp. NPDC085895 TaxID=3155057 RepID=UPI0034500179
MDVLKELQALVVGELPDGAVEGARRAVAARALSSDDHDLLLAALGLHPADGSGKQCPVCGTRHHRVGLRRRHDYCSRSCYEQSLPGHRTAPRPPPRPRLDRPTNRAPGPAPAPLPA